MTQELFWLIVGLALFTVGLLLSLFTDNETVNGVGAFFGVLGVIITGIALGNMALEYSATLPPMFGGKK